jgi:molybdopterin-containing oxidoreductase family iron-sulfur binding subunit
MDTRATEEDLPRGGLAERLSTLARERGGRGLWRGLQELADDPRSEQLLAREHPERAAEWSDPTARRDFLKLMGASMALAGVGACTRQPTERILPYAARPEDIVPGQPLYFATAMPWAEGALGLLVESHMGRPTKVEGNPEHPASRGATDALAQAEVLTLYDPDRSQVTRNAGRLTTWEGLLDDLLPALETQAGKQGQGLRVLTRSVTSPTLHGLLGEMLARLPKARWHQYEPVHRDSARAGALLAFGQDVVPQHRLERAGVVLSLGAELVGGGPQGVAAARALQQARTQQGCRLYVAESCPTLTGAKADHRLACTPEELAALAAAVAAACGVRAQGPGLDAQAARWAEVVAADLLARRGESLVVAGAEQPPQVHALAHALNQMLGNVGETVVYSEPAQLEPVEQARSIELLVEEMRAGEVELLIVLGANPCYDAPADLDFTAALQGVPLRVHMGLYADETAGQCHWHTPEAHFLEAWGDARAADGTVSIVQPLIAPLYGARSAVELVAYLAGKPGRSGYELVREHWSGRLPDPEGVGFEKAWRRALHDGLVAGTALPARSVVAQSSAIDVRPLAAAAEGLAFLFRPDPAAWDGRYASNGWLQECPRPLSKLVWDNAALIGPDSARRLELSDGDVVRLTLAGRSVTAPVLVTPGHAEDCVTLPLGYGRRAGGELGVGVGFDAYALRSSDAPWQGRGLQLERTGARHELVTTQLHHSMEGRDLVRRVEPGGSAHRSGGAHGDVSMYPPVVYEGQAWGMSIDLDACTGCNACVVACQAENNIPVVGKREVARGREMHWLRIDRYFEGDPTGARAATLRTHFQPVPCMHCENAPCEVVCPVGATVHSHEGLNDMVYNRCVGTRYCSNNCPFKVRRFNFFRYADFSTESLKMQRNPDVTVRSRGVMEKCTYCVQRISAARIQARKEDRTVADGEVVTACQGACPPRAIHFGDQADPSSEVARHKASPRSYGLLDELQVRPRTTYLAEVERGSPLLAEREG